MKPFTALVLIVSLVANALLAFSLASRRSSAGLPAASDSPAEAIPSHQSPAAHSEASPAATLAATPADAQPLWEQLSSHDPATLAANLRAAGFSLGAVRGAVYALLWDLQTTEREAAAALLPAAPFWKNSSDPAATRVYQKEIGRLWHERDKTMRSLFPEEQLAYTLRAQARYGKLPAEKLEALANLERDYLDMRLQLVAPSSSGLRMPWAADQTAYLEQEKRKDIAAILTPEELEQFDLRASSTALAMRNQLAAFNPTEEEYLTLFRLRAAHAERLRAGGPGFATTLEGMQAQRELAAQIKDALGETRADEYQRANHPSYRSAYGLTRQLGLPPDTANEAYALTLAVQQREAAVRANTAQTAAEREAQLAAIRAEASEKLSTLLTPRGAEQFHLETGGLGSPALRLGMQP